MSQPRIRLETMKLLNRWTTSRFIIRDRSSVIADFIETGSLSDNYLKISSSSSESDDAPYSALPISSVKFNATDKDTIELNSQQNEAFESFRHDYNFDVDGSTPFEEEDALLDNIEEYVDKRLDDLSKAIDSTNPLKKLDDYRDDHEKWTENKQSASDSAWSDKQQDASDEATSAAATAVAAAVVQHQDQVILASGEQAQVDAWTARLETLDADRAAAEESAVNTARGEAEDQAWTARLETLDADRASAEELAVTTARDLAKAQEYQRELDQRAQEQVIIDGLSQDVDTHVDSSWTNFVDSLNSQQFSKLTDFFENVPALNYNLKFKCSNCGHKNEIELRGLQNFFG